MLKRDVNRPTILVQPAVNRPNVCTSLSVYRELLTVSAGDGPGKPDSPEARPRLQVDVRPQHDHRGRSIRMSRGP